ncbi:UNVERIFIED_CONTAM: protein NRT1/ PTR FAMILY 3.1 [Sesamum radiatum]|uniref:Protein NRT1/ PTR FAMILY 3.1 n=1 Tax=Sesamum radiatum TaxID=300843 RepID=A0AAW2NBF9_SESRA
MKMSENGEQGKKEEHVLEGKQQQQQLGGVRTMPFILANEVCDRFGVSGFHANMITYLTQVLNLPLVKASNTLSNFGGTSNFTPLIGALLPIPLPGGFGRSSSVP